MGVGGREEAGRLKEGRQKAGCIFLTLFVHFPFFRRRHVRHSVCAGEFPRSARVFPRLGAGRVRPPRNQENPHCPASEKVAGVERLNSQVEERARCSEP